MTLSEAVSKGHDCLRDGTYLDDAVLSALLNGIAHSECALAEAKKDNHRLHLKLDASCDAEELRQVRADLEVARRDAGMYAASLRLSANLLGCDEHMLEHAVRDKLAELAEAKKDSARLIQAGEEFINIGEEFYDMESGDNGSRAIEGMRAAIEAAKKVRK